MSLNIDMKVIRPVKFSGVSPNINSNSLTSCLSCNVLNPGKYSTRIPLARRQFCPSSSIPEMFWITTISVPMQCLIGSSRVSYQAQYRLTKKKKRRLLCAEDWWCTTNQRQILSWSAFTINCLHSIDLILFGHQFRKNVEHLFHCEIFCILDGMPNVQVILPHEDSRFQCYRREHSPNHRMFFSVFHNIHRRSFLVCSARDHSPYPRMIWILETIPILSRRL